MTCALLLAWAAALGACGKAVSLSSEQPLGNAVATGAASTATSGRLPPQIFGYRSIDVTVDRTDLADTFRQAIDEYRPVFAALGYSLSFSGVSGKRSDCADPAVLKTSFLFKDEAAPVRVQCVGTFYIEQTLTGDLPGDDLLRSYLKAVADFWREYQRDPSIIKTM